MRKITIYVLLKAQSAVYMENTQIHHKVSVCVEWQIQHEVKLRSIFVMRLCFTNYCISIQQCFKCYIVFYCHGNNNGRLNIAIIYPN